MRFAQQEVPQVRHVAGSDIGNQEARQGAVSVHLTIDGRADCYTPPNRLRSTLFCCV